MQTPPFPPNANSYSGSPELSPRRSAPGGWPPAARWAAGCGSCCGVSVLLQAAALLGILSLIFHARLPPGLVTAIRTPAVVTPGRKFPFVLVIHNAGNKAFIVSNITLKRATAGG